MSKSNVKLDRFSYRISSLFDTETLSLMNAEAQSSLTYNLLSEYIISKHGYNSIISGFNVSMLYENGILKANISPGSCVIDGSFISVKSKSALDLEISDDFNGVVMVNLYYDYRRNIYEYSDVYIQINVVVDGSIYPNSYVNVRKGFLPISIKTFSNGNIFDYDLNVIQINGFDVDISYLRQISSSNINIGNLELEGNYMISNNKLIIDSSYRYTFNVNNNVIENGIIYVPGRINQNYLNRIVVTVVNNSTNSTSPPMIYPYDISVGDNYILINDRSGLSIGDTLVIDYVRLE